MARIRTIKPEIWTDERLTECSVSARLLFIGMLNFSDDNGNQPYSAKRLKMQVFPADSIDTQPLIEELITHGVVSEYSVSGEKYLHIKGFKKHQVINRPSKTSIPEPLLNEDSVSTPAPITDGREGKGREGKEQGQETPAGVPVDPPAETLELTNVSHHPDNRIVQGVLTAYHEILPECRRMEAITPKLQRRILAAHKLAKQLCRQQGWEYTVDDFWRSYFGECLADPWLRGEVPNPKNVRWKQNLTVLLDEERFAEIMDRAIASLRTEAVA